MKRHLRVEQLEERDVPAAGSTLIPIGVGVDFTLSLNSNGRVATMQLAAPDYLNWLNGSITAAQVQAMTQRIYQYFPDQFDHILFVDNTPDVSPLSPYFGVTFGAKNETLGTGERLFNNTALFGSAGRLQTAIHLASEQDLRVRTSLHELLHLNANFLPELQSTVGGHWGFSSVGGQLGGWAPGTLRSIGPGLYDADGPNGRSYFFTAFGDIYDGDIAYSNLELYLEGLIDATQVDPVQYATTPRFTNQALGQFSATSIQTLTIDNIISKEGLRIPTPATSQKNFRGLTVVITANPLTQPELDKFDTDVELLGKAGSDGDPTVLNFWEATGGRATLQLDGLTSFLPGHTALLGIGSNGTATGLTVGASGKYDTAVDPNVAAFFGPNGEGVRTAVGDVDGDNIQDFAVATGPGPETRFAVISGDRTRFIIPPTAPFRGSESFTGGAFVSVGDIDGDGREDVVVSADQGGGPRVVIFSFKPSTGLYPLADFFGIDDPNFRGGARTALGDINHDGRVDLAVSAGPGGGPRVALYNGLTFFSSRAKLTNDFFVYPGAEATALRNGVYLSIGDLNGDGYGDLITGAGAGGGPRVLALSGKSLLSSGVAFAFTNPVADFFSGDPAERGGVRVTVKNVDGDAKSDIVTGSGEGSVGDVRVYRGAALRGRSQPVLFQDIPVSGDPSFLDGVFVG